MRDNTTATGLGELLARLVACPSVNPGPAAAAGPEYGERAMADLLAPMLRTWGAAIRIDEWAPGRCSLVATWPGSDAGRALILDAHLDTVGTESMTVAPFAPQVRNGRLYGRGACDTKGPMAAMLMAIRRILDEDGRMPVTIHFAAAGDEEAGATGVSRLVQSGLRAGGAIVAEPTQMALIHAHKGACRFRIALTGRAAHTSVPAAGVNAVEAACELVGLIRREFVTGLRHVRHGELGDATVCSSVIAGGRLVNVVPDQCRIEIDCRCLPGEERRHLEGVMAALTRRVADSFPGLSLSAEVFQWYPAMAGSAADPFAALLTDACRTTPGFRGAATVPYATDGGFYSEAGIPSVVFGPGSIAQAHTAEEFIDMAEAENAVGAYAAMIRAYARAAAVTPVTSH